MSVVLNKAAEVIAPYSDGVAASNVRSFTAPNTVKCNAVPAHWQGQYVTMLARGADVFFFFSFQSAVGPDGTLPPADDGGADPQLGAELLNGQAADMLIPVNPQPGGDVYFCRVSAVPAAYVTMRKSSP
jgi:hypothetical protein